jgi:hypothetical protein
MDLQPYVETIHQQLLLAAEAGGDEARALAKRLVAALDAAIRLTLQDALGAAAQEITVELAPGSVELRLRDGSPEFVVTSAPAAIPQDAPGDDLALPAAPDMSRSGDAEDGAVTRINLRMPDHVKTRVEQAAAEEGFSVNTWLVRAAGAALERGEADRRRWSRAPRGPQRYTGWTR